MDPSLLETKGVLKANTHCLSRNKGDCLKIWRPYRQSKLIILELQMNRVFLLITTISFFIGPTLFGAQFKHQDARGHYFYRCDMTNGGSLEIVITNQGFYTKGGAKPVFRSIDKLRNRGYGGLKRSKYNARQIASYACGETIYLKLEFRSGPRKSTRY